jgi:HAD superfamily hydrolase (TIGR01490 family)
VNYKISAFDLDHTLARSNTSYQFGSFLYNMRQFPFPTLINVLGSYCAHKSGFLSLQSLHSFIFKRLFLGRSKKNMRRFVDLFLQEFSTTLWNPALLQRLKEAQQEGHFTIILSSSPDFIVQDIAEKLNVDRWYATPYHADEEQRFVRLGKILCGHEKALRLAYHMEELNVSQNSTYAYSDSHLDLPFLNVAGNPHAVNPDRKLKQICQQKQWPVL